MKKPELFCSLCPKVAWYHLNGTGFCGDHYAEALKAQSVVKALDDSRHAAGNFHAQATAYGRQR